MSSLNTPYPILILTMEDVDKTCASLRSEIAATETQLSRLKQELASVEHVAATKAIRTKSPEIRAPKDENEKSEDSLKQSKSRSRWPLLDEEFKRYGRQMIVEDIGLKGWVLPPLDVMCSGMYS